VEIPDDQLHKHVRDYWPPNTGWEWSQLQALLPPTVLQRIASYDLVPEEFGEQLIWAADDSGRFTIKSALTLLRPAKADAVVAWKWIWKLRIPQRIKVFVWLLFHRKLLTNAERFRRHLCSSPSCERCQGEVEDLEHVFRSCPRTKDVWHEVQLSGVSSLVGDESSPQWV